MPKTEIAGDLSINAQFEIMRPRHRSLGSANGLTDRERDILTLVARGLCNQDIANKLGISRCTVKEVLHRACSKLGAQNRLEAIFVALTRGYIAVNEILSLDELASISATMEPQVMHEVTQRLKQKRMDEMVNMLAPLGTEMLYNVAQRLKQKQEQFHLPPIASDPLANPSPMPDLSSGRVLL